MNKRNLVLGLEAGLGGGTLSILEDGRQVDFVEGAGGVSKSEDLLGQLSRLLERNNLNKREIGRIVISDEPGSLTGIRIGLASAKGLSDALGIEVQQISILEAMGRFCGIDGNLSVAVGTSSGGVYFRQFNSKGGRCLPIGEIKSERTVPGFFEFLEREADTGISVVMDERLWEMVKENFGERGFPLNRSVELISGNPGEILGKSAG